MKKAITLLMVLALSAAAITGCSNNAAKSASGAAVSETANMAEETGSSKAAKEPDQSEYLLRIGSLKGPTSMGLVKLMDESKKGESAGTYEFTMVTAADELLGKMINGDLDIALVPANMAGILFNKTNHGIRVIDINTLGVLYVVTADDSIKGIRDLKGKTVYLTGKGTTPDYTLQYLLQANQMYSDDVTLEYKSEASEVASILSEQPDAIGLLPQPFATVAIVQNEKLKPAFNLTDEWDLVSEGGNGSLVTGVTICRSDLLEEQEDAVKTFLDEHKASAAFANDHTAEAAQLVAEAGIIEKAQIAEKALPYCSITYVDGSEMQTMLNGYLTVLHNMDPKTVGGEMPVEEFYYMP